MDTRSLCSSIIKYLVKQVSPRQLLVYVEIFSAIVYMFIATVFNQPILLVGLLLLKGSFEGCSKVARPVALKYFLSGNLLSRSASTYNIAALAGSALGALLSSVLVNYLSIAYILLLCIVIHLCASTVYWFIPDVNPNEKIPELNNDPTSNKLPLSVQRAIGLFIASVLSYQGFHNIVRAIYPIENLGTSTSGIGTIQFITSIAYIVGATFAAKMSIKTTNYFRNAVLIYIFTTICMLILPFLHSPIIGFSTYGLFAFLFEVGFCLHLRTIIIDTPKNRLGDVVANSNAWALGSMVVMSMAGSVFVEWAGLIALSAVQALVAVAFLLSTLVYSKGQDNAQASHTNLSNP